MHFARLLLFSFFALPALFSPSISSAVPIAVLVRSTFDFDLEGWSNAGTTRLTMLEGVPPGAMEFQETFNGPGFSSAPAKFLGDWSLLDQSGSISFDHKIGITNPFWGTGFERIILISGPGGSANWVGPTVPQSCPSLATPGCDWTTFTAPVDEAAWTVDTGTWLGLLSDVTSFQLRVDHYDDGFGGERTWYDNIQLVTPEPSTAALLALGISGLAGWSRRQGRRSRSVEVRFAWAGGSATPIPRSSISSS